jgi:hypothetical protein
MSDSSVDDDGVLLAALDFIDTFDTESDSQSTPTASTTSTRAKRPYRTSSERTRQEIERLRAVVAQLEARVAVLQAGSLRRRASAGDLDLQCSTSDSHAYDTVSWEKTQRALAQTKNVQLRELLTKQTRFVTQLERLVERGRRLQAASPIAQQLVAEEAELGPHRDAARAHSPASAEW